MPRKVPKIDVILQKSFDEELKKAAKRFTNQDSELTEEKFLELLRALKKYDEDLDDALERLSKYEEVESSNFYRLPLLLRSNNSLLLPQLKDPEKGPDVSR